VNRSKTNSEYRDFCKYNLDIEQQSIIQIDTCIASWRSDDLLTTYLIAQSRYSNASYCLVCDTCFVFFNF
jgi:hypothetical protein